MFGVFPMAYQLFYSSARPSPKTRLCARGYLSWRFATSLSGQTLFSSLPSVISRLLCTARRGGRGRRDSSSLFFIPSGQLGIILFFREVIVYREERPL